MQFANASRELRSAAAQAAIKAEGAAAATRREQTFGIGLRPQHFRDLLATPLESRPALLEIMSDNLVGQQGGPALWYTEQLAAHATMLMHGVGLNIGGAHPLNRTYLQQLRELAQRFGVRTISDHLAFTRTEQRATYELLPLPRSRAMLAQLCERIELAQDLLGQQLSLENTSAYVAFAEPEMSEAEFLAAVVRRSGCGLLLDVNNLFVNAHNFGEDPQRAFAALPLTAVTQLHIAGHTDCGDYLFDTHDQPAAPTVVALLRQVLRAHPHLPVILEWDDDQAPLATVLAERQRLLRLISPQAEAAEAHW